MVKHKFIEDLKIAISTTAAGAVLYVLGLFPGAVKGLGVIIMLLGALMLVTRLSSEFKLTKYQLTKQKKKE